MRVLELIIGALLLLFSLLLLAVDLGFFICLLLFIAAVGV